MSESRKKIIRNDIIIILIPLVVAIILFVFAQITAKDGSMAVIELNGKEIGRYLLDNDICVPINEDNGKELLVFNIENGNVFVNDAKCKDRSCERTGRISRIGESIICLPYRIVIRIEGNQGSQFLPDAIAFFDTEVWRCE